MIKSVTIITKENQNLSKAKPKCEQDTFSNAIHLCWEKSQKTIKKLAISYVFKNNVDH